MSNNLLKWFEENYEHVLSHYIHSVSRITRTQRKSDLTLDARRQPAKTVLDLYNVLDAKEAVRLMENLADDEENIEESDVLIVEIRRLAMLPADGSELKDGESDNPMDILMRIAELTK